MLAPYLVLDLPCRRRRCRSKPHSSTHTMVRRLAGASRSNICAYALRAVKASGVMRDTGKARNSLKVHPILVNARDIVVVDTAMLCSRKTFSASIRGVLSAPSFTQVDIEDRTSFDSFRHHPSFFAGADCPNISCRLTMSYAVVSFKPKILATDRTEIKGFAWTCCKKRSRMSCAAEDLEFWR